MPEDDEARIVRDLLSKVERERSEPIQVMLPDPGPYILPRMTKMEGVYIADTKTFELFLETAKGQRVRVPIAGDQLKALKRFVDHLSTNATQP